MVKSKCKLLIVGASTLAMSVGPVVAQNADTAEGVQDFYDRGKYTAVKDRPQPDFDPVPMQWGSFFVRPELRAAVTADSNLFASDDQEESDVIAQIGASLNAKSNWNNHKLEFDISGHQNEYLDFGSESNFDFRTRAKGELDVTRAVSLVGEVYYEDRTEERTQIANRVTNVRPIQFDTTGATVGIAFKNDRTRLAANFVVRERNYEDGQEADGTEFEQDFRDRTTTSAVVSASYAVTPNVAVFAQGRTTLRDYDVPTIIDGDPFNRDSNGYDVQAGIDFELDALLRGKFGVGYLEEDRNSPDFDDIDGLFLDGTLQWFPSQLVTVTGIASRRSEDRGLIDVPSAIATKFGALVDYEIRRNIVLSAAGEISDLDFQGDDRTEDLRNFSVSATYKLNRRVGVEAFARLVDRDTEGFDNFVGQSFQKNVIGIGINLYPY